MDDEERGKIDSWYRRYRDGLAEYNRMFGRPPESLPTSGSPLWDDAVNYGLPEPGTGRPLCKVLPFRRKG